MDTKIRRCWSVQPATMATTTASASVVDCRGMAGGIVALNATPPTAATRLTFYASDVVEGPYRQLFDKDGAAVSVTLVTSDTAAYALPLDVGGVAFVRIVSDAELGTANAATVQLKG